MICTSTGCRTRATSPAQQKPGVRPALSLTLLPSNYVGYG